VEEVFWILQWVKPSHLLHADVGAASYRNTFGNCKMKKCANFNHTLGRPGMSLAHSSRRVLADTLGQDAVIGRSYRLYDK